MVAIVEMFNEIDKVGDTSTVQPQQPTVKGVKPVVVASARTKAGLDDSVLYALIVI